ncbi:MAG TPA: GyrI-like domain-containing protein [Cytophagaceae bacterium]|nr:GyrI-like domain-containing protein [Cytophagaceae bacterium]
MKTDLTKLFPTYYKAGTSPELVELGEANFLSIAGKGDPSSEFFASRVQALYTVAYAVKFYYKKEGSDFTIAKLEGLWWFDTKKFGEHFTISEVPQLIPRQEWHWELLLRLPDFVSSDQVKKIRMEVFAKKKMLDITEVEYVTMKEGKAVQMLHEGSFANEPASLEKMQQFMQDHQLQKTGMHHEIYLSDFRKTAPEKLKTILREPVRVVKQKVLV